MSEPARPRMVFAPMAARPPLIDDLMVLDEAARVILFDCLAHIHANIEPVRQARQPEALHQLRVGLRRLRVAFDTFGDHAPVFAELGERAALFAKGLGPARELDVFLKDLFTPAVADLDPHHGIEILRARAERARDRAWDAAVTLVNQSAFLSFHDEVEAAARGAPVPVDALLSDMVTGLMQPHRKRVKKRGKLLQQMDARHNHRLRIALKKLRYAAEFFAPLYKGKAVKRYMAPLKDLQDLLGHLNDVAEVRTVLGRLMIDEAESASIQADLSHAAGLIQGWHHAHAKRAAQKTLTRWKRFKDAEPFWV